MGDCDLGFFSTQRISYNIINWKGYIYNLLEAWAIYWGGTSTLWRLILNDLVHEKQKKSEVPYMKKEKRKKKKLK